MLATNSAGPNRLVTATAISDPGDLQCISWTHMHLCELMGLKLLYEKKLLSNHNDHISVFIPFLKQIPFLTSLHDVLSMDS